MHCEKSADKNVAGLQEHWNGDILGYYVGYKKTVVGSDKPYLFETVEFFKVRNSQTQTVIKDQIKVDYLYEKNCVPQRCFYGF